MSQLSCAVLGAGSFGTALASVLLANGHDVTLWCYEPGHAEEINEAGRNTRFQTAFELPGIAATNDMATAVSGKDLVLFVSPSHATRFVARAAARHLTDRTVLVSATKGIEQGGETMAEVLLEELGEGRKRQMAFLSGPSFAFEVLERHPTAVVAASWDHDVAERVQNAFATSFFRVYTSEDVVGVELGGAVKNIIAIAAGACDGLGFGHNARAAIITRGLAEISRLGAAQGAKPMTFMGLAGMGDLVLTCTGDLSRNRTVGKGLGAGMTLDEVTESLGGQVAEGVRTTASTHALAASLGLDMPIVNAVHAILYGGHTAAEMVGALMGRPLKRETE